MKQIAIAFSLMIAGGLYSCTPSDCVANQDANCACIEIYEPVCGCDDVTYSNSCHAECAGIKTYTEGECN